MCCSALFYSSLVTLCNVVGGAVSVILVFVLFLTI